jgi:hypothetical protein
MFPSGSRAVPERFPSGSRAVPGFPASRKTYSENFTTFVLGWDLHVRAHCQNADLVIGCFVETLKRGKE